MHCQSPPYRGLCFFKAIIVIETVSIGKIVASFGLQGELVIRHALGRKTDLKDLKVLFIEDRSGNQIPYFVVSAKAKNHEEVFVKLEGIDSREAASLLLKKQNRANRTNSDLQTIRSAEC